MAKKKWPTVEKARYYEYIDYLIRFGKGKGGVKLANGKMLEDLGVEETPESRKWVTEKFRRANPNYPDVIRSEYLSYYEDKLELKNDIFIEEVEEAHAKHRDLLDKLIELFSDDARLLQSFDDVSADAIASSIAKLIEAREKGIERDAKIRGLLTERSQVEISTSGEGDPEVGDTEGLSEALEEVSKRSGKSD